MYAINRTQKRVFQQSYNQLSFSRAREQIEYRKKEKLRAQTKSWLQRTQMRKIWSKSRRLCLQEKTLHPLTKRVKRKYCMLTKVRRFKKIKAKPGLWAAIERVLGIKHRRLLEFQVGSRACLQRTVNTKLIPERKAPLLLLPLE